MKKCSGALNNDSHVLACWLHCKIDLTSGLSRVSLVDFARFSLIASVLKFFCEVLHSITKKFCTIGKLTFDICTGSRSLVSVILD